MRTTLLLWVVIALCAGAQAAVYRIAAVPAPP